jgi:glycyl-tRNA synthetase alpha chain
MFKIWESEAARLLDLKLVNPGYDAVIKCSHMFNLLDARGAISVSERVGYIGRVRQIARKAALAYHHLRAELGYPLIKDEVERTRWVEQSADAQARLK